ncbi:MAG: response regulator transcription factor [Candidatus Firestonebacteria bacterium]
MKLILIVEDEEPIRRGLKDSLKIEGYKVIVAEDGEKGYKLIKSKKPDLVLLDILLPKLNGIDLCKKIRSEGNITPIVMLTAKGSEIDKVLGLELGADDYVTKPFSLRELISRIKAIFRRLELKQGVKDKDIYSFNNVKINFKKFEATKGNKKLNLSAMEFKILKYLISNESEVVSRDTLLDKVWGYDEFPTTRTVDNFIAKLRSKIESDHKKPKHLFTIYGVGYKFLP